MSIKLSKNLEKVAPSATVAMTQLARELKNEGTFDELINFNENFKKSVIKII